MPAGRSVSPSSAASGRDGFTIVEVVIAMVMLAVGVLGVMHLAVTANLLARDAGTLTELGIRAENSLEAARDRGYAGNSVGVTTDSVSVRGLRYARRITVTDEGARARSIRVDVIRAGKTSPAYSTLTYVVK